MKAMILSRQGSSLEYKNVPNPNQVLLRALACGVCRTDLHILDGDLPNPKPALILGHEIVGVVVGKGAHVTLFEVGDRVGVPWLGRTYGGYYCQTERENLCD